RPVLDRSGRVVAFELRQQDVGGLPEQTLQSHQRRIADGVLDGQIHGSSVAAKTNPLLYRRQKPRHAGGVSMESRRGYFFAFSSAFIALSSFFASVFAGAGAGGAAAGAPLASGALAGAAGGGAFDSLAALLSCVTGVDAPVTEILSLSGPKVPSLMPGTFMMSS